MQSASLFYQLMKGHKYEEAWDDDEFKDLYSMFEDDEDLSKNDAQPDPKGGLDR